MALRPSCILVQRGRGLRIAEPEVDGVRVLLEGYAGEGHRGGDVGEDSVVFVAEVVVLGLQVARW